MNHAISGEILAEESRFPRSEIFFATLVPMYHSDTIYVFTAAAGSAEVVIMLKSNYANWAIIINADQIIKYKSNLFVARFRHFYRSSFAGISNI